MALQKVLQEIPNDLTAVYCNRKHPERFWVGQIVAQSTDAIVLDSVDNHGHRDGLCYVWIPYIYRIESECQYLHGLKQGSLCPPKGKTAKNPWALMAQHMEGYCVRVVYRDENRKKAALGVVRTVFPHSILLQTRRPDGVYTQKQLIERGNILFLKIENL